MSTLSRESFHGASESWKGAGSDSSSSDESSFDDEDDAPEALKSGGLKVHLSLAEFPPNGVRQQSASTVLVTQHGRGLPCAGLVGSNTYCIQCRIAIDSLKKIWTFVVKFTPSRASVSSPEADGRHDSQS